MFFSAGNLNKNKRFKLLIEAFVKAFSADEELSLRIAGEGAERGTLEQLIRDSGRERQIQLLGRLSREEIAGEYRKCRCFALLSCKETFGIAYREAMAVGRPVIAARNGGIEDGWNDGNGVIIDELSLMPDVLKRMRDGCFRYNGEKISARCLSSCSPDAVLGRLEKVLADAINPL